MADKKRVFVLLIGSQERGEINHFQLLQGETAASEGRHLGLDVEVAFAPGFDQLRVLKKRLLDASAALPDAVVTEPANTPTLELILAELKGKLGLVVLSAWGPAIERAASSWGDGVPIGSVGTDHTRVGEIQGLQTKTLLHGEKRALYVAGPLRSSAAQQRLAGLKSQLAGVELEEISAGKWTESDGIVAFNDWYRVAKARDPVVPVIAAGNDELALGARRACEALSNPQHREALLKAKFLGVDACPGFGQKLITERVLTASVLTPANTGLALSHLNRFWTQATPLPLRSFTEAQPWPASSLPARPGTP